VPSSSPRCIKRQIASPQEANAALSREDLKLSQALAHETLEKHGLLAASTDRRSELLLQKRKSSQEHYIANM